MLDNQLRTDPEALLHYTVMVCHSCNWAQPEFTKPELRRKIEDAACHQIFVERLLTTSDDNNDFDRLTEQQHNKRYAKRWRKMLEMLEYANN